MTFAAPNARIRLPTHELMMALRERLRWVPGERGTGVDFPDVFEVTLSEFPKNAQELEQLLGAVQEWLNEVDIETLTIETPGTSYTVQAQRR